MLVITISEEDSLAYTTKLLAKHNDPSCQSGTTISRNGKELDELSENVLALVGLAFELDTDMGVVCVTSGLDVGETEALERSKCLVGPLMLDVPSLQSVRFCCS